MFYYMVLLKGKKEEMYTSYFYLSTWGIMLVDHT